MSVPLTNPGLPDDDPRQLVYGLFKATGLSILLVAPRPIEDVLKEAVRRAPVLADSSELGRGVMRLNADPTAAWVALETPAGSAVAVFAGPDSDTELIFRRVMLPFESATTPFVREAFSLGSGEERVVSLLDGFELVPVAEFAPFDRRVGGPLPTMPITARRHARHWRRLSNDLYASTVEHPHPTDVFMTLSEYGVELMTVVGEGRAPSWTNPLVSAGTHRIEVFDPTVMIAQRAPVLYSGTHLDAVAQRFVEVVQGAFETARENARPHAPVTRSGGDIWARVGRAPGGMTASRPWARPAELPTATCIEWVRESRSDETSDESSFDRVDRSARWLRQHRGSGFEHSWRSDDGALLSPAWLTLRSAVVDPVTGNVVGGGHLNHECFGMAPAHDLGAIDGRNGMTFPNEGHPGGLLWPTAALYVGSVRTGVLVPIDTTLNVYAVDFDPASGSIAVLHHLGSSTAAVTVVSPSGTKRLLSVVEGIGGGEPVLFSGDGAWLLVPRPRDSVLIEVTTGRRLTIDVANTGWWPGEASTLVSIHHDRGKAFPALFDLSANAYSRSFPHIELDVPLLETYPFVWRPAVSADCTEAFAVSPAGVSVEYQREHGTGSHLVRFSMATGRGVLVSPAFLNADETLERDVSEARWLQRPSVTGTVRLHPDLHARLEPPVTEHEWAEPGRWADEGERMLVLALNTAVDRTKAGESIAYLLPEVLAYLVPIAHGSTVWARRSEWLVGLRDTTVNLIASGTLVGELADSWRQYGSAIAAIEAGRPDSIDPINAAWVTG